MKTKKPPMFYAISSALIVFVVGMRCGIHDEYIVMKIESDAKIANMQNAISDLTEELEYESQIEHVVVEYEYLPMPVDYPVAEEIPATEIVMNAQMAYGEDKLIDERPEAVAAAMETAYNRVDSENQYFPDTLEEVITQESQYHGYSAKLPVDYRYYLLALDTYYRHRLKILGVSDYGYVIPDDCVSFCSNGDNVNRFYTPDGKECKISAENAYSETVFEAEAAK